MRQYNKQPREDVPPFTLFSAPPKTEKKKEKKRKPSRKGGGKKFSLKQTTPS